METVEEIYNKILSKPLAVLEIFNDFFGEEFVDMQGFKTLEETKTYFSKEKINYEDIKPAITAFIGTQGFILVHFPYVRITNENNKSIDITHLWAKIAIDIEGKMISRFTLNRSEYTTKQFLNNYMH